MEKEISCETNKKKPIFPCNIIKWENRLIVLLFVLCMIADFEVNGQGKTISKKNISFIEYPGFPVAHSTWGSIGSKYYS